MSETVVKDFKVKNGLLVTGNGSFGGPVSVGTPTALTHAATKAYVDSIAVSGGGVVVSDTAPETTINGTQWLDTTIERLKIFYNGEWLVQATYLDSLDIIDHTHDTSIGGDGRLVNVFYDPGTSQINAIDGGGASTEQWSLVLDGGTA